MKKIICLILSVVCVLALGVFMMSCDSTSSGGTQTHEHTYSDNFTCHDRVCTICGKVLKASSMHEFSDSFSCHDRTCKVCGETIKATSEHITLEHCDCEDVNCLACGEVVKAKVEHTFGKLQTWKVATCTEDGAQGKLCSVCGYKSNIVIPHLGHDFDDDGNCVNTGCNVTREEYEHLEHCYSDSYSCHDRFCTVCGHLERATTKHLSLNDASCAEGYCFLCGEKISTKDNHNLTSIYTCIDRTCSDCGNVVMATTEHSVDANGVCACGYKCISSDFTFEEVIGGYKVTKYNGSDTKIIIPSTYNGKTVVQIGDGFVVNNKTLEGVSIPNSITSIGYKAFCNCTKLVHISFTAYSSLVSLADNCFEGCKSLTYIYIPKLVSEIPFEAFKNCQSLKVVDFNENLKKIGASAFSGCSTLRQVDLPSSLLTVEERAFSNCSSLIGVNYNSQSKISSISRYTFYNCSSLVKVNIPSCVTYIGDEAFFNCNSLIEVTIPESVLYLSSSAFKDCIKLVSVRNYSGINYDFENENTEILVRQSQSCVNKISYNEDGFAIINDGEHDYILGYFGNKTIVDLTENYSNIYGIYNYAFFGLPISKIIIPASVKTIGNCAFKSCSSLNSVDFESGSLAEEIGSEAFSGCSMLVSLVLPKNITKIGDSAFFNCKHIVQVRNLSNVEITVNASAEILHNESSEFVSSVVFDNVNNITKLVKQDRVYLLAYSGQDVNLDLTSSGITDIGSYAFEDNSILKSIILPANLKTIGECAFKYCKELTSITIPASVTEIGRYAFADCIAMTTCTFNSNILLSTISDGLFENCAKLTAVVIPKNVLTIGTRAFYGCNSLETLTIESGSTLKKINDYGFFNCLKLSSLTFPSSIEEIGNYAFSGCTGINSLVFGEDFNAQIKKIGEYAFNNSNISLLDFGKYLKLEYIGAYAFTSCSSASKLILPNHALTIKLNAFKGCSEITEFYCQTKDIWEDMDDNDLTNGEFYMDNTNITKPTVTRYYYSEEKPVETKYNFWHYVNGEITIWEKE